MIDLCISGTLDKDSVVFSLDGATKTIDQFSREIHFSLEENQVYRIYFEQRSMEDISRYAGILLNVILLPIRGIFNVITFNSNQHWEADISAFKLSGYIDVCISEDTKVSFKLKRGNFAKESNSFTAPVISFSPDVLTEQSITPDDEEISKEHSSFLWNIASVSILWFALMIYLSYVGFNNDIYIVRVVVSILLVAFSGLLSFLVVHSFKKKKTLLEILVTQGDVANSQNQCISRASNKKINRKKIGLIIIIGFLIISVLVLLFNSINLSTVLCLIINCLVIFCILIWNSSISVSEVRREAVSGYLWYVLFWVALYNSIEALIT